MPKFTAKASGIQSGNIERAKLKVIKLAVAAVDAASDKVLEVAKQLVPVDTGELVSSGGYVVEWKGDLVTGTVSFTAGHAGYVEFGTGIRGAASPGAGPYPYNANWKGMRAQPYLRPALDISREEIKQSFSNQGLKLV